MVAGERMTALQQATYDLDAKCRELERAQHAGNARLVAALDADVDELMDVRDAAAAAERAAERVGR